MLSSLHIENIAVIRCADLDLSRGFTAFTGETGAGKSLIIDGINLLLGNRADRELIRRGESRAMVSGVFEGMGSAALAALSEAGVEPDEDGRVLIQRTLTSDGHSSVRINGRAATVALLREIGPCLISIHGQNDNRQLSGSQSYLHILDGYAHNEEERRAYGESYRRLSDLRRRLHEVTMDESERLRMTEMLRYQVEDIDALSLHEGEEEELSDRRTRLRNAERISRQTGFVYRALKGSEKGSVSYILSRAVQSLGQLSDVIPASAELTARLEECMWQVDDVAEQVRYMWTEPDGDPTELLNRVEDRLDRIARLRRKYGNSVSEILAFRASAAAKLAELEGADDRRKELEKLVSSATEDAIEKAKKLHEVRAAAARQLQGEVTESLSFLDMPRVRFQILLTLRGHAEEPSLDATGYDDAAFMIAVNPGEAPGPMEKLASGGELSRIMLALKSVIADRDGMDTVIYDEVDTGVSGRTARKIGLKLRESAKRTQVLSVTHSAQIASLADSHYIIEKKEENGRASTEVRLLDREGRIAELSRILGGIQVTDAQRMAAMDMLEGK